MSFDLAIRGKFEGVADFSNIKDPDLLQHTLDIHNETFKMFSAYVSIAGHLKVINRDRLFARDGFSDILDYAKQVFGWKQANIYTYLKVGEKFTDDNGKIYPEFEAFSLSQLDRLSSLGTREQIKGAIDKGFFNPQMSAKTIQKTVKAVKDDLEREQYSEELIAAHKEAYGEDVDLTEFDIENSGMLLRRQPRTHRYHVLEPKQLVDMYDLDFMVIDYIQSSYRHNLLQAMKDEGLSMVLSSFIDKAMNPSLLEKISNTYGGDKWAKPIVYFVSPTVAQVTFHNLGFSHDFIMVTLKDLSMEEQEENAINIQL